MITIINYNAGNIASVKYALERLGCEYKITSDVDEIKNAEKIIFPGVGRALQAMNELKKLGLVDVIKNIKVPFLGICLGLQLFAEFSEEDDTQCLGIIEGRVKRFSNNVKIPQIGWNQVDFTKLSPLTDGILNKSYFYFVNSYYFDTPDEYIIGKTDYGISFPSIIQKNNFYATQFHPEKSGEVGEILLSNFIKL